jgi:hypothetical protein
MLFGEKERITWNRCRAVRCWIFGCARDRCALIAIKERVIQRQAFKEGRSFYDDISVVAGLRTSDG